MSAAAQRYEDAPVKLPEAPRPLFRDLPPSAPYPIDKLGPVLGPAAQAIAEVIQCPVECAANSVLAVGSLAAQGLANVVLPIGQGKRSPLSLFLMTVLDSGERKSSADGMALKPVRDVEKELDELSASDRRAYNANLDAYEANRKHLVAKMKADRNALEAALLDLGQPPQPPLLNVLAPSGDQTMEGLFRIYQQGRPSLAMLCDDAATFLGGHSLKAEQKVSTTANLCRAWDGSKLERIRGGDGVIVLYDRRLASHLMVQPGVAAEFLSDAQFADQGLIARFLLSAPAGRAGTRFRNEGADQRIAAQAAEKLNAYNRSVAALLRKPVAWKDSEDRALGVEMADLQLSEKARSLYIQFVNAIESELGPKGRLAGVKPFASKLPENAARIAGIFALLENPDATVIQTSSLAASIKLAKYHLSEAQRLVAAGAVDPLVREADSLREWLIERGENVVALRTIYQLGPNAIRQASRARAAMNLLADHGWVIPIENGAEIEGRQVKEAWKVLSC